MSTPRRRGGHSRHLQGTRDSSGKGQAEVQRKGRGALESCRGGGGWGPSLAPAPFHAGALREGLDRPKMKREMPPRWKGQRALL